jgi:hypothetical protein
LDKDESKSGFRFVEPNGLAPRRHHSEQSPKKEISPTCSPRNKTSGLSNPPLFHSLSCGSESVDDGFTELLDLEKMVRHVLTYGDVQKFPWTFLKLNYLLNYRFATLKAENMLVWSGAFLFSCFPV